MLQKLPEYGLCLESLIIFCRWTFLWCFYIIDDHFGVTERLKTMHASTKVQCKPEGYITAYLAEVTICISMGCTRDPFYEQRALGSTCPTIHLPCE